MMCVYSYSIQLLDTKVYIFPTKNFIPNQVDLIKNNKLIIEVMNNKII
jgi:hypothetical protein